MHFEVEHELPGSRLRVLDVLCDPSFHTQLDLPDLSRPEVVKCTATSVTRYLRLRYTYIGQVDAIARKIMGGGSLTWIQELRLDTVSFRGTLSFSAEHDTRLSGSAEVVLAEAAGGASSRRTISGDLHVRVPLVGGTAERRLVPGLTRRLDVEAEALSDEITRRAS
jgi:Protein of unknown function (DUF2505)